MYDMLLKYANAFERVVFAGKPQMARVERTWYDKLFAGHDGRRDESDRTNWSEFTGGKNLSGKIVGYQGGSLDFEQPIFQDTFNVMGQADGWIGGEIIAMPNMNVVFKITGNHPKRAAVLKMLNSKWAPQMAQALKLAVDAKVIGVPPANVSNVWASRIE